MSEEKWYCPAVKEEIAEGLCYEYYYADRGGPDEAAQKLNDTVKKSKFFKSIEEFHNICDKKCPRY